MSHTIDKGIIARFNLCFKSLANPEVTVGSQSLILTKKRRWCRLLRAFQSLSNPLSEDSLVYTSTRALQAEFASLGGVAVVADLLEGVAGQQPSPDYF